MGTLEVVFVLELIKAALLRAQRPFGRSRRLFFQRAVHALVAAILLRLARRDPFHANPQPHPPHAQPAQSRQTGGGERRPIIAANRRREPVLPERGLQHRASHSAVGLRQRLTAQQVPAPRITEREGVAASSVPAHKPPFEIHAPHPVRCRGMR